MQRIDRDGCRDSYVDVLTWRHVPKKEQIGWMFATK